MRFLQSPQADSPHVIGALLKLITKKLNTMKPLTSKQQQQDEVLEMLHTTIKPMPDKVVRHVKRANVTNWGDILYCIIGAASIIAGYLLASGRIG